MAHPTALRRLTRPEVVRRCVTCGELAGRGYPDCHDCADQVERYWVADWQAALEAAGQPPEALVRAVLADGPGAARYPWTCVDWALRLSDCAECGAELATGHLGCVRCAVADERRWAYEQGAAGPGGGSGEQDNERALRLARAALRAPARHRATVVTYWRLLMPFLLTGETAGARHHGWLRASLLSGRYDELAAFERYADLAAMLGLPWRAPEEPTRSGRS